MLIAEPRSLLRRLNSTCTRALEKAAAAAVSSRHYEVTAEHVALALMDDAECDWGLVFAEFEVDPARARVGLEKYVSTLRSGNAGRPVFSPLLLEWMQDAWVYGSTELNELSVRSGALLVRLVSAKSRYLPFEPETFDRIPGDDLRKRLSTVTALGKESAEAELARELLEGAAKAAPAGAPQDGGALARFTTDLTERAKSGALDPVLGREAEIRQVVDILSRRRKNNPILVGEPGVGKTALVEGLALRIAEGTVPDALKNVRVLVLDLGALQAGASVKGEFENRLKGVIGEVKASAQPIVLFIDEAHTLIGAGGQQGGGDAANLLKPALARGELRTIAATTWSEFKRYFEKDAALERRFQPVKVDEPSAEVATLMMRGLARKFEEGHGVFIQDEAVRAAVSLSSRYISGRQLPDKAVDLLDTAAARVKVLRASVPGALEDVRAELKGVERELEAMKVDDRAGIEVDEDARVRAVEKRRELTEREQVLAKNLENQLGIVGRIDALRGATTDDPGKRQALKAALSELKAIAGEDLLVHADVDESLVAAVVADWTGIPTGKMVKDDVDAILNMEGRMERRVRGQSYALSALSRELRAARSGLKPPSAPLGVFLLVGPSGVGKTETALSLADLLFGGERFLITINMSEFQERHTVSRLIGSPPGYVGYGQGGILTEAVRQRPYSVVLLDEVEKADREVLNLFYQVFDKGMLSDGEGRVIDFRNTVLVLTSNLATDLITGLAPPGAERPPMEDIIAAIRPTLSAHFKPALLARMTVIPYVPIEPSALTGIVKMKLSAVVDRAKASHNVTMSVDEAVYQTIADRCREVESGARNVDHILRGTVMPLVSREILEAMAKGEPLKALSLRVGQDGSLRVERG